MSLTLLTKPQQPSTGNKWSAVHMPVIYELQTDLSPNTAGPSSGVASYNSNNGYLRVDLGGIGTVNELEFVKIVAPNAPEFEGVHQVIQKEAGDVYTLDIAYESGTINWASSIFTKFYSNYYMTVRVYAGLVPGHPLAIDKPVELAAELRLIPDSEGKATFSVHEVLKSYVKTVNNREDTGTIGEVDPYNDIDFFTNFYISYAESYDVSNGYTLSNFTTGYTTDTFTGNGVNAHLRFRNAQGTFLTDYMNNKFLTLFAIPVLFACSEETPLCFQDISAVLEGINNFKFKQEYYSNGVKITETLTDIPEEGDGIYRIPLTSAECTYDRVDVSVIGDLMYTFTNQDFDADMDPWGNADPLAAGRVPFAWQSGGTVRAVAALEAVPYETTYFYQDNTQAEDGLWPAGDYTVEYDITNNSSGGSSPLSEALYIRTFMDDLNSPSPPAVEDIDPIMRGTSNVATLTFTLATPVKKLGFQIAKTGPTSGSNIDVRINYLRITASPLYEGQVVETKSFDIECGCSEQEMRLVWLNNLGGFDYWNFEAQKTYGVDIARTEQVQLNKLLVDWVDGSTIRKEVRRESNEFVTVRSQYLTLEQLQAIMYLRSSVLVQQIFSPAQKRTVLVDNSSFEAYSDGDKLYSIQFRFRYTDDIPVQSV